MKVITGGATYSCRYRRGNIWRSSQEEQHIHAIIGGAIYEGHHRRSNIFMPLQEGQYIQIITGGRQIRVITGGQYIKVITRATDYQNRMSDIQAITGGAKYANQYTCHYKSITGGTTNLCHCRKGHVTTRAIEKGQDIMHVIVWGATIVSLRKRQHIPSKTETDR